jgi:hypothetical protein
VLSLFFIVIPNANLPFIPNVCRRFVRKPMCMAFARSRQRTVKGFFRVTPIGLAYIAKSVAKYAFDLSCACSMPEDHLMFWNSIIRRLSRSGERPIARCATNPQKKA